MTDQEARLLTVTFGPGWQERTEMGLPLIDIPEVRMPNGEVAHAVFVRGPMSGYPTRLFFDRQVASRRNLPVHVQPLLGQVMYAHSINNIPATLPPHEAILAHLQMYK